MKGLIYLLVFVPFVAFGQEAAADPVSSFLDRLIGFVGSAAGASTAVGLVLELVFRLIPTSKPLSIAHIVAAVARKIGDLCSAVADLLDSVLPQKTKEQP